MKKEELERDAARYDALVSRARELLRGGLYREAVTLAREAWPHIDGMMRFKQKYEDREFTSLAAIDLVLKYAPLLMDRQSLDELEKLLKDCRRIEKNTKQNLGAKLSEARSVLWNAHRLWDYLEMHPDSRQDELRRVLGGDQEFWRSISEEWDRMGLVERRPEGGSYRLSLATRLGKIVRGKCPGCGGSMEAPKAMFFEPMSCPGCGGEVLFVILSEGPAGIARE